MFIEVKPGSNNITLLRKPRKTMHILPPQPMTPARIVSDSEVGNRQQDIKAEFNSRMGRADTILMAGIALAIIIVPILINVFHLF